MSMGTRRQAGVKTIKALENKGEVGMEANQIMIGTAVALPSQPAETPQQKDEKTMAWYANATLSRTNGSQPLETAAAVNASGMMHAANSAAESSANPIIARAFALQANLTEAY